MHIDGIEAYYFTRSLTYPWRTAYGQDAEIHSVLVRMVSGTHSAWGETCPLREPTYSPETATSAFFLISELFAPALVGQDIESAEDLLERLSPFKGNPFAKAGVESAWWMLKATMAGEPLHRLLGGETRDVACGAGFGIQDSYDMLLEKIQSAVDAGFPRVKLKMRPGWDLEMLRTVRSAFPDLTLQVDCNATYSLDDLPLFRALDDLDLAMIEQPLFHTDLFDHAELQQHIRTPICLDESVKSVRDFELALRLGSCRILNIKYTRVGGLSVAVRLHDLARDAGVPCWVGGVLESCVGQGIRIELATLPNFTYPNDLSANLQYSTPRLTESPPEPNPDCTFSPSAVPGIAYQPLMDRVADATIRNAIIRP